MRFSTLAPWPAALAFVLLLAAHASGLPLTQAGEYTGNRPDRVEEVARGLRRTVLSLTSEQRNGRRAGTKGELDTALWLVSQLRNYNLTPAGEDEYLQPFEVPLPVRDGGDSWIQAGTRLEGAQQVVPLPSSAPGGCKGPVEFHGLGLESEDLLRRMAEFLQLPFHCTELAGENTTTLPFQKTGRETHARTFLADTVFLRYKTVVKANIAARLN